ncbi:type IV pilin protein [Mucilaginibacter sp. E4BP6]|uniref:type IV pilin protein n=1 Tax=Mucilaginibacter sp. E4BP6 TaxID=2723089 RepID=UPI0015CC24FB|nr:type II secretion system protein [Mucilaginibacter sp. E4BP6]NYE68369.1 type IV pilus assembly protein PilE [Mucilaginibacter sp. E4BP6]
MKPKTPLLSKKLTAYSLTEVLVVLCIIGILSYLAWANLSPVINRAHEAEAKVQLAHVYELEKSYFYEHSKYSTDLNEIGFVQEPLTTEDKKGKANYRIDITDASNTTFTATATAVVDFSGNGTFNVWRIDQNQTLTEVTKN